MKDALKFWGSKGCHQDTKKRNPDRRVPLKQCKARSHFSSPPRQRAEHKELLYLQEQFLKYREQANQTKITPRNQRQQRSKTVATTRVLGKQRQHQRHRKGLLRKLVAAH